MASGTTQLVYKGSKTIWEASGQIISSWEHLQAQMIVKEMI